ncbi:MAG: DUF4440 domain-containing protein [Flavobacteriaceae bacterium]|jgi:hypothetical protein|nr:DUF4440 domain-containing protein [Flavobacteriaceae bacterium]MAW51043.1 DUF4440 domain-containing protein [Flavobacteriaceae bacterium]|tara:strand:- start:135 stop:590 length:456 start_codon:yes stop_codon:yes gene_type:complete
MTKTLIISLFFLFQNLIYTQDTISLIDKDQIRSVLKKQETDWNKGDIDSFMKGYLNSNDLVFNGSKGPFYGFKSVKERYKNTYPTKNEMGKLKFEILKISGITKYVAYLVGKYILIYPENKDSGFFTLTFVKLNNEWLILSDHTSKSNNYK